MRILIADDSDASRKALRFVLEQHPGWEICGEAVDGLEAVEKAALLTPDIVILDLTMPKMNGFQVARTLQKVAPKMPLLLCTMHLVDVHMIEKARAAGFRGAVSKVSPEAIVAAIGALLEGKTLFGSVQPEAVVVAEIEALPEEETPKVEEGGGDPPKTDSDRGPS